MNWCCRYRSADVTSEFANCCHAMPFLQSDSDTNCLPVFRPVHTTKLPLSSYERMAESSSWPTIPGDHIRPVHASDAHAGSRAPRPGCQVADGAPGCPRPWLSPSKSEPSVSDLWEITYCGVSPSRSLHRTQRITQVQN